MTLLVKKVIHKIEILEGVDSEFAGEEGGNQEKSVKDGIKV